MGCNVRQKIEIDSSWNREVNKIQATYEQCYTIGKRKFKIKSGVNHNPQINKVYNRNDYSIKTGIEW